MLWDCDQGGSVTGTTAGVNAQGISEGSFTKSMPITFSNGCIGASAVCQDVPGGAQQEICIIQGAYSNSIVGYVQCRTANAGVPVLWVAFGH